MAAVAICDRCGGLGTGTALGGIAYKKRLNDSTSRGECEICPRCVASFVAWLANPEPGDGSPFRVTYQDPVAPLAELTDGKTP